MGSDTIRAIEYLNDSLCLYSRDNGVVLGSPATAAVEARNVVEGCGEERRTGFRGKERENGVSFEGAEEARDVERKRGIKKRREKERHIFLAKRQKVEMCVLACTVQRFGV